MRDSLNNQTYENMRRDIMTLALMPGEPVSAARIAERYNVSRTPAREALVKLETEALVDIYPQVGSVISKIDERRAMQEWFVRKTLEMGVIDGFFEKVTDADIPQMREYCQMMEKVSDKLEDPHMTFEYLRCDNMFHSMAFLVAGQDLASQIVGNTMTHYNRVRLLVDMENANKKRTLTGHEKLIKCIEKKDKETYRESLSRHIGNFERDMIDLKNRKPELFKESN
ncbi:MAG: GntR family transcriptional regulator [Lachnospiraceae bacterium]|nr:GntR family transcriptional regulator [Lachnospiraceae bacterium]